MSHETHMHEEEKEQTWEEGRELARRIKKAGGIQRWVDREENRGSAQRAFAEHLTCVCCMDDRVSEDGIRIAGSGVLIKDNPAKRRAFIKKCREEGVTDTTCHPDCGALLIHAETKFGYDRKKKGDPKNDKKLAAAKADMIAWAKELANELGGSYLGEVGISHDYHVAQAAHYDMTGHFNPWRAPDIFEPGFPISRKHADKDHAKAEVTVAIAIATGNHGYGKRFSARDKFVIRVVAHTKKDLAQGLKEVRSFASSRVRVEGVIIPAPDREDSGN